MEYTIIDSKKLQFLETARTIAMAWVVFVHVFELSYVKLNGETWFYTVVSTIGRFTVPTFFIISGFLLGQKYLSASEPFDHQIFLKRKFSTLCIPFIAWNILYMFIFYFAWELQILHPRTLFNLITGYMHLYFIFVLMQFFLIFALLHSILKTRGMKAYVILSAALSLSFYGISEIFLWRNGADGHFFEWHYGKLFFGWSLFFFWGVWIGFRGDILEILKRHLPLLLMGSALGYVLFFFETYYEVTLFGESFRQFFLLSGLLFQFLFPTFFLTLLYSLDVSFRESRWRPIFTVLGHFGKDVYGIYLSHVAVLIGVISAWKILRLPEIPHVKIPTIFITTTLITWIFLRISSLPSLSPLNKILWGGKSG